MGIKSNIIRVFSANLLTMISGILIGFIVPAVLSLDSYAYVKTYTLYVSYIGFLHLGFIDGMYIKYGGKEEQEIDRNVFKAEHHIFIISQLIATTLFFIIGIVNKDFVIILLAISILPINTGAFHKLFYQSTGQFKKFAQTSYIYTIIYLSLNLIFAFILKTDNYILYCLTSLIGNMALFVILEYKFYRKFKNIKAKYDKEIVKNVKVGFVVLIANLGIVIFNATDLWFVKLALNINDFAYYSFAVSMLNIINVMIMSVSITFYNYLAKGEDGEFINKLKKYFIIIGAFSSLAYFAFSMIVNLFIQKYIPSLAIIAISFAAFPYMILIKGLFVNLYRARKNEKKYLKVMISMVVIAIIYNTIAIIVFKRKESIAYATLISFITWGIYSGIDLKYSILKKKEIIYLISITSSFLILANKFNWFIGGIIYLGICIIFTYVNYKDEILGLLKFKELIKKRG
ncbi:MAG: capsular biosynthesis protein [Clostridium sp.]